MSKYWEARQEKRENSSFDKGTEAYKEYVRSLEQAKENINAKIAKLYAKHSEDTRLAKAESMKIIQGKEYKEWRYKIEDYVKQLNSIKDRNSIEFKKLSLELETLASRSRINRLESLKADIDMELIKAGVRANDTISNALTKTYSDTYKSLIDDLNYKNAVDMDRMKKVIGYDWSGANYSKRIWGNTESLAKTIKNEVLIGLNQGINYKTMSTRIANKFETSKKNAERLVRTEINYIHNQATVDGYKDAGVEKYQFLATLDSRTSQTCAGLNGEIFEVKNIAVGINYPPMHPRCRSTTVPIIDYASLANMSEKDFEEKEEDLKEILSNQDGNISIKEKKIISYEEVIEKAKIIANEVNFSNIADIKEKVYNYTDYIIKREKLNGLPKVVSSEEFKKLSKDKVKLYRGVADMENIKAIDMVKDFKYGELFTGKGIYGNGTYATPIKELAKLYETKDGKTSGKMIEMILSDDAKTITFIDLYNQLEESGILQKISMKSKLENYEEVIGDLGNFGMLKGYDVIMLNGSFGHEHYVILDRAKLIVKE